MKKKSVLLLVLYLIFLIVFNTVFFVGAGFEHPDSVWLSYGFIHFAYLMVLLTSCLIRKSGSAAVFGFSLYSISSTYFMIEFIVGVIFIFLRQENVKAALIVQIIIAGVYAVILLSHLLANESTADSLERREEEVSYIKSASSRLKYLIGKLDSKKANREIEKVYDLLHASPTRTIASVHFLEMEIKNKISELESAVAAKDNDAVIVLSGELQQIVEERNRKIRVSQ